MLHSNDLNGRAATKFEQYPKVSLGPGQKVSYTLTTTTTSVYFTWLVIDDSKF